MAPRRGLRTKTHFQFRIDLWDASAGTILAHVAGIDDLEMAMAAYRAHALAEFAGDLAAR